MDGVWWAADLVRVVLIGASWEKAVAMRAAPDTFEPFDIHCGSCGGEITVQLRPADADATPLRTRCTCPWCATEESRYELPGDVLWVTRGHHANGSKPQ